MLTSNLPSLVSMDDIELDDMMELFKKASHITPTSKLKGKIMAALFFEPSTRTRLSFESAMLKQGGSVMGFSDSKSSSIEKGETLSDTIRIVSALSDVIVLRHPLEGAARLAKDFSSVPVINGGDGSNEHPTQTLTDLFTLWECLPSLHKLEIGIAGDLKHSRTVHSLIKGLKYFEPKITFICSPLFEPEQKTLEILKENRIKFSFSRDFEVIPKLDVLYLTRHQKERTQIPLNPLSLGLEHLKKAKPDLKILHPLPRQEELKVEIDSTLHALYFKQAANGLKIRQALLLTLLEEV